MLTLVSNANTQFEPATINLPDGRLRLGIPTRYIENRYFMALVGTAWVMSFGYLLGFILEVWVISWHRRFQQVVFIEN
ncbi:hypothetical protein PCANC_03437 [Puccinia coronata f. sp. avenae]|uniref:Uncharacterized protein n=1 Tax=Puccinia coronata f. sp. avenae TaxID=200324 RepID=A0A2N5W2D3_9BASI|nr:hypothetical protein PCANC_03437 [Puccinia coronata f. sp. avenae]